MKPRHIVYSIAAALGLAAIGLLFFNAMSPDGPSVALRPDDAKVLAAGEIVYRTHCIACHGARLEGQPNWRSRGADGLLPAPPHDASGHTWHHSDETLVRITKLGVAEVAGQKDYKSAMPAYAGVLSDMEIVAVLSWIKAQWPRSVRETHDQINARDLAARKR